MNRAAETLDGAERPAALPATSPAETRAVAAIVLVSIAIALVVFARQLLLGEVLALRDFIAYTWPARQALVDALRAGRLPEWNDWVGFGMPFAAMPPHGVAYPPQWLAALFPLPFGAVLVMALHLCAAGIGTGLLSRRLGASALGAALAAGALMTSGYVAANQVNGTFQSIAWVPWVAWAADRLALPGPRPAAGALRGMALLAVMGAGQLLSGDPASALSAGILAAAVTLARSQERGRATARLAVAGAFAVLLAAASILPSLAVFGSTSRTFGVSEIEWSMHPWRLLELVWPQVLGDPVVQTTNLARAVANSGRWHPEPSWSYSVFLGGPILALAVLGGSSRRGNRGILLASGLIVGLALGGYTPLHAAWRSVFPPERVLQYPEKHLLGAVVLWCALAGAGLTRLRELPRARRAWFVVAACLPAGAAVAAAFALRPVLRDALVAAASKVPAPPIDVPGALSHSFVFGATAFVLAGVAAALLAGTRTWMAVAGVALSIGHAAELGRRISPVVDGSAVGAAPALLATVAPAGDDGVRPRVLRPPRVMDAATARANLAPPAMARWRYETLVANTPARYGFGAFPGEEGFRSKEFDAFRHEAEQRPLLWVSGQGLGAFASLLAIEYLAFPAGGAPSKTLPVVGAFERWRLLAVPRTRPRAFVAQRWRSVPSAGAVAAAFAPGRELDPGLVLLTDAPPGGAPVAPPAEPLVPCAVRATAPEDVLLDCSSPYGGYAVLMDEHMPGWSASVDGAPAEIAKADVLFRAVRIGQGAHSIHFRYRTPWLREGIAVSAASWLAVLALLVVTRRRRAATAA